MAASVLLGSADGSRLHFSPGGGGGCENAAVGTSNGLGPPGPAPWNRSVDRALEEATVTGCLNLSGRKLKEFPRSSATHDLTDTTRADLSRNRLSELPLEVCVFVSLESLNLYQNCLRSLPDSLLNLQALTYLNLSRNQLSVLPPVVCSLPLKVLIASNNKLGSLPEQLGQLRHLTELDVSCNEIQTLPAQVGQLEALRDLNVRRNHLIRLPPELAELPLVRLDFSCNKVTSIPVCYRRLTQLQAIVLDNNPLQAPPAQICIKGKVHIFKYLNLEANKSMPEPAEYERRPLTCMDEPYPGRPYGALDSGFNSVDSGDKRWLGIEPAEEALELRGAETGRDPRQRGGGALLPNGTGETRGGISPSQLRMTCRSQPSSCLCSANVELEQIDFIDSYMEEDEEKKSRFSLSSQFMAYIEKRITREGSPVKNSRSEDSRRLSRTTADVAAPPSSPYSQKGGVGPGGVERMRKEAQLAALRYEEERQKNRSFQREGVGTVAKVRQRSHSRRRAAGKIGPCLCCRSGLSLLLLLLCGRSWQSGWTGIVNLPSPLSLLFQHKPAQSPTKSSEAENTFPSRRSTHTDDSALFMGEDRATLSPTGNQSSSYLAAGGVASCRMACLRPESFLFRLSQREEKKRGDDTKSPQSQEETPAAPGLEGEEAELVEQLRKNIEARLKVSLPSDLGAALTDGVVLCHLANHVRPRSVPSIHVPSPAVPKLTMAKCRRNVENFLEACRRIGVPQNQLCLPLHILEQRGLSQVAGTVDALLNLAPPRQSAATATPPGPSVTI
ncbi:Leucine-rich repeat and calponin homology domain-containing protein 3 [Oryzias melastigma]|uniref:Leucine-rich repeat and calponin homology domain-containing protein 3 n=1 Tax=Oryzias melastigma TaxID=30732 RepID=A0A834C687_ORYME|nr:Leucine-rich repeat and calponin homology domain-containing protein 3 [Oryzias melastigma]